MDKDTIKNGLRLCANGEPCIGEKFISCPFSPRNNAEQNCGATMARNALALLKEKEQMYYTLEHDWRMCRELLKEQEERIKSLEHQLETSCKL